MPARAYGPGVADMMGGLVASCFALRALKRAGELPFPVRVLYTVTRRSAPARRVLIWKPRRARPGGTELRARTGQRQRGQGAQGRCQPDHQVNGRGRSRRGQPRRGRQRDPGPGAQGDQVACPDRLRARHHHHVGLIEGGTSSNTVAPSATARLDVRFVALADWPELQARIEAIVAEEELPGTRASVTITACSCPWKST